ncbi:uncharacterized protein EDB93DRAFT_1177886 [Suillus bovinus]|uniref:uncharacterized protein n=1 Tax=Suillus bovinus TaxID=48563 RepID=UPI001B885A71|nr:uncharacterized protein EDB93DRAFT_1177886 [Suillus bovinus]KAG2131602.1 hypothetical protein EDB93DRAFT_1177886 [Suillus bovinus]
MKLVQIVYLTILATSSTTMFTPVAAMPPSREVIFCVSYGKTKEDLHCTQGKFKIAMCANTARGWIWRCCVPPLHVSPDSTSYHCMK